MRTHRTWTLKETADGLILTGIKTILTDDVAVGAVTETFEEIVANEDVAETRLAELMAAEKPAMAVERELREAEAEAALPPSG